MTVADTGVVLALLDEEHPRHAQAKRTLATGPISVSAPTLTEVTRIIRRHAQDMGLDGNEVARHALRILRSLAGYRLAASPPEDEVAKTYTAHPSLSYADAWNLATSLRAHEPLATFDKKLQRIHGRTSEAGRASK